MGIISVHSHSPKNVARARASFQVTRARQNGPSQNRPGRGRMPKSAISANTSDTGETSARRVSPSPNVIDTQAGRGVGGRALFVANVLRAGDGTTTTTERLRPARPPHAARHIHKSFIVHRVRGDERQSSRDRDARTRDTSRSSLARSGGRPKEPRSTASSSAIPQSGLARLSWFVSREGTSNNKTPRGSPSFIGKSGPKPRAAPHTNRRLLPGPIPVQHFNFLKARSP